ncbi:hypothetical protein [Geitlerinema sp. PCC 7407]|uniref:hypothetical protein n=1 Tax=Geitlerinema sp. PCC 7407 TaxID=1173025 RepID=UPI0002EDC026|nr:hypothetical protein [Geitlerinema sp. PCC 7407]
MEYLLMDLHRRFLGTMNSNRTLSIGDTFEDSTAKTYTVVRIDPSRERNRPSQSLTVVRLSAARKQA